MTAQIYAAFYSTDINKTHFKDLSNQQYSRTFKELGSFQEHFQALKMKQKFQDLQGPVGTLAGLWQCSMGIG